MSGVGGSGSCGWSAKMAKDEEIMGEDEFGVSIMT
jgi:hypothetical protein